MHETETTISIFIENGYICELNFPVVKLNSDVIKNLLPEDTWNVLKDTDMMRHNVVHVEIKICLHLTLFPFKACNDNEAIEIEDSCNMSLGYSYLRINST